MILVKVIDNMLPVTYTEVLNGFWDNLAIVTPHVVKFTLRRVYIRKGEILRVCYMS